jgi:hypothetical protein
MHNAQQQMLVQSASDVQNCVRGLGPRLALPQVFNCTGGRNDEEFNLAPFRFAPYF